MVAMASCSAKSSSDGSSSSGTHSSSSSSRDMIRPLEAEFRDGFAASSRRPLIQAGPFSWPQRQTQGTLRLGPAEVLAGTRIDEEHFADVDKRRDRDFH